MPAGAAAGGRGWDGRYASGGEASRWAIRVAVERYYDAPGTNIDVNLRSAIEAANNSLYQYLRSTNVQQAGCTMAAVVIHGNALHIANVGDSRVYLLRDGQISLLTRDHSVTQQKVDQGLIRPEDAAHDPDRNVITRSMGTRPEVRVDVFPPIQLVSGDVVLVCSDGLTDMVSDAEIPGLVNMSPPQRVAKRLIAAANKNGGVDNISVVLAQVGGKPVVGAKAPSELNVIVRVKGLPWVKIALVVAAFVVGVAVVVGLGWLLLRNRNVLPEVPTTAAIPVAGSTATPTVMPTDAQVEDTPLPSGGPTSTPLPTQTPTATPEVGGMDSGDKMPSGELPVRQISPELGLSSKNPVSFVWEGKLRSGQAFQLVTQYESSGYEKIYSLQTTSQLSENLPAEKAGEWVWWVQVVEDDRVVAESERWHFYLVPLDVSTPIPTATPGPERPGSP